MDRRKFVAERLEGGQQREQGSRSCRFNNHFVTLLAYEGVVAGEFELPRNPDCLVSTILEKLDVSFWHMPKHMPIPGRSQVEP